MSESEVGLALEPFGQVGHARRRGGAGLGLPLTKALVEANGAELTDQEPAPTRARWSRSRFPEGAARLKP